MDEQKTPNPWWCTIVEFWKARFDGDVPVELWKFTRILLALGFLVFMGYLGLLLSSFQRQLRQPEHFVRETLSISSNVVCPGESIEFRIQVVHDVRNVVSPVAHAWYDVHRSTIIETGTNEPIEWRIVPQTPREAWLEVRVKVPISHSPGLYYFQYSITAANADILELPVTVKDCEENHGSVQRPDHQDDRLQLHHPGHGRNAAYPRPGCGEEQPDLLSGIVHRDTDPGSGSPHLLHHPAHQIRSFQRAE